MNARKRRRLAFAAAIVLAAGGGAALVLTTLSNNVLYFYSPSDIVREHVQPGVDFRVGGLVKTGSVKRGPGTEIRFVVTDGRMGVKVDYNGVLPDLFREGQGVIAIGALQPTGVFDADQILAKHDAKYMPPEVVDALKRAGRWKEGSGAGS